MSSAARVRRRAWLKPWKFPHGRTPTETRFAPAAVLNTLEARDPYTHGHSRRVARHAAMIAKRMGLSHQQVAKVRTAGALHDVGEINTPAGVLHKPGRLTDGEFDVVKLHPGDGAEMVAKLGDAELTAMVRHHHERLDGAGYPDRLPGEDIPLGARIIAVADTFDAITSTRPYRSANPHKKAIDILAKEAGTQLDPAAVRAFDRYYSGRRPLALWVILTNVPERLISWLGGGLSVAGASVVRVMALSAMTGAVASAAVSSRLPTKPLSASRYAEIAVTAGAAHRDSQTGQRLITITPAAPANHLGIAGSHGQSQTQGVGGGRQHGTGGAPPAGTGGAPPAGTGGGPPAGTGGGHG